eukprot:GHRR01004660.1.p1 GENE.GHRR01004660.1~~GHRR01004660.1.p1  ORF type:complete len:356 (+),score=111.42 GHRR01004660.1:701-1768(+)
MLLDLPAECTLAVLKVLGVADVLATGTCCKALHHLISDDKVWSELAEVKWGRAVRALKPHGAQHRQRTVTAQLINEGPAASPTHSSPLQQMAKPNSKTNSTCAVVPSEAASVVSCSECWKTYCCKRMSLKSIRRSPLSLLQESYPDPWQHIICCVLCTRTSGSSCVEQTIHAFFGVFPTPTAVLEASTGAITALIHPLGLQATRVAAVKGASQSFLACDWQDPAEFYGCGRFVSDSWRIFCKGCRDAKSVNDAKLKQYLAWANRQSDSCEPLLALDSECRKRRRPAASLAFKKKRSAAAEPKLSAPPACRLTRAAAAAAGGAAASAACSIVNAKVSSRKSVPPGAGPYSAAMVAI